MALLVLLAVAGPAAAQQPARQVVVVAVEGLRWEDVSPERTPALARLAQQGARGVLSVRAAGSQVTCPADGWLTLGAGSRAASGVDEPPCTGRLPEPEELPALQARPEQEREGTVLGALGAAVRDAGGCIESGGSGSLAAAPATGPPDSFAGCPVRLVEGRAGADLDRDVALADTHRPPGSTLLVVGVSEAAGEDTAHLHVALAVGPEHPPGALVSASTRRAPYVQLVDVAPTVLDVLGVEPPAAMAGQPWRSVGDPPSLAALRDLDRRAVVAKQTTVPFFVVLIGGLLAALAVAARRRSWRLAEVAGLAGTAAVGASYAANLVPWWRAGLPLLVLVAVVAGLAAVVVAGARRVPGLLGPAGAVCALVTAVLVADLVTGARLQVDAVAGYSPLVAGRFAGIGNVAFGVLLAASLLATAWLAAGRSRRTAAVTVAVAGLVVVAVDGAPAWGSDVGGVLALVPAYAVLGMLRTGTRVSLLRLAAACAAAVLVVAVLAAVDLRRDAGDRTHLGRFAAALLDGEGGTLLRRKAGAVLDLLFANPVTALLPLVVAGVVLLLLRPPAPLRRAFARAPAWRDGTLAVAAGAAVGFVLNDSGPAVVALAILLAAPATVAVTARAARAQP